MDTITINDIDYSDSIDGLDGLPIEVRLNDSNKTIDVSITGELIFKGRAYELIRDTFFSPNCDGRAGKLSGSVYLSDICVTKQFVIRYDQVTYDPCSCQAEVNLKIESPESECYRYLNSTAFWQNGFINAFTHPKIHYCSQPGLLHWIFLFAILPLLCPIIIVIRVIVAVIDFLLPGEQKVFDNLDEFILGCGKRHVAPVIREVMQFHTSKCGLTFQSSILINDQDYSNSAILLAQNERGKDIKDGAFNWIDENRWNVSPVQILDKIKLLHNADYRITGGKLTYERKDHFLTVFAPAQINLIDFCTDGTIERFEYSIIKGGKAYGKFEYQKDAVDTEGTRMINDYNDIVDWNDPPKEHLTGEHLVQNEFSPARFMFDRMSQEKNGILDFDRRIDIMRSKNITGFSCPIFVSNPRDNDLILENQTSINIKVLALERNTPRNDAKTIKRKRGSSNGHDFYDYNYPYYYDANYSQPELYQNFHFIDDPNLSYGAYYQIEGNVTILLTKQLAQDILQHGTDLKLITHLGNGKGDSYTIDRDKKQVVISGIKIPCVQ